VFFYGCAEDVFLRMLYSVTIFFIQWFK